MGCGWMCIHVHVGGYVQSPKLVCVCVCVWEGWHAFGYVKVGESVCVCA